MRRRLAVIAAVSALALAACESSSSPIGGTTSITPGGQPTTLPIASTSAMFSLLDTDELAQDGSYPLISCSDQIGGANPVAIVSLGHDPSIVLRDYSDPANPRTLCDVAGTPLPTQLLDAWHLVLIGSAASNRPLYAVVDLPDVTYHWFALPNAGSCKYEIPTVGPKLDQVTWSVCDEAMKVDHIHLFTTAGDSVVADLPDDNPCGMESTFETFSASGADIAVLNAVTPTSLVVLNGSTRLLSLMPPAGGWPPNSAPSSPTWVPGADTLLYLQGGKIWRWTQRDGPRPLLNAPNADITVSSDGKYLAFGTAGKISVIDVAGSAPSKVIASWSGFFPRFLNQDSVLYRPSQSASYWMYDVGGHSARASTVGFLDATWPAV